MAQALEGSKGDIQNIISRTIGYLDNYHKVPQTQLRLVEQYNWAGNSDPTCPIPPTIPWRDRTQFRHQGPFPGGSVAGVVYSDGNDSTARKWLVAFDRPNQKVYVEAGPYGPVDWNGIKARLDQSGPISQYKDPILGGTANGSYDGEPLYVGFGN